MNGTRRMFGQLAAAFVVGWALAGSLIGGVAAAPVKLDDAGKTFEADCLRAGGEYREVSGVETKCIFPGGSSIQCDGNGKNCYLFPARVTKPGIGQVHVSGGDTLALKPDSVVVEPTPTVDDTPVVAPANHKHRHAHGKKHGHGRGHGNSRTARR